MVTDNIKKAVASKDLFSIRSYLTALIITDKTLSGNFKDCFEYCLKNGILESQIYEAHDGAELLNDVSEDNYKNLRADLNGNFSKQRVEALKQIAMQLYPPQMDKNENSNKLIYAIVAGAAILVGAIFFAW